MTKNRRLTKLFAALLALAMLVSVAYLALEARHDCTGEDCAVCAQLDCCLRLLERLTLAGCVLLAARLFALTVSSPAVMALRLRRPLSLISLKVKLSD